MDRVWPQAVVIVLIAVAYGYSLFGGFTSDDWAMIVDNEENMGSAKAIPKFFTTSVWAFSNVENGGGSLYRPAWLDLAFLELQRQRPTAFWLAL